MRPSQCTVIFGWAVTSSYQPDNYALPDQPIRKTSAMATREVKSSLAEIAIIIILIILLKSGENGENIS